MLSAFVCNIKNAVDSLVLCHFLNSFVQFRNQILRKRHPNTSIRPIGLLNILRHEVSVIIAIKPVGT